MIDKSSLLKSLGSLYLEFIPKDGLFHKMLLLSLMGFLTGWCTSWYPSHIPSYSYFRGIPINSDVCSHDAILDVIQYSAVSPILDVIQFSAVSPILDVIQFSAVSPILDVIQFSAVKFRPNRRTVV